MNNYPPFYVGQKVVALTSVGSLVKGRTYTVLGLFRCEHCNVWYVQHTPSPGTVLNDMFPCCMRPIVTRDYRCAMASKFAPIYENFQAITLEKVVEVETPLISVN